MFYSCSNWKEKKRQFLFLKKTRSATVCTWFFQLTFVSFIHLYSLSFFTFFTGEQRGAKSRDVCQRSSWCDA